DFYPSAGGSPQTVRARETLSRTRARDAYLTRQTQENARPFGEQLGADLDRPRALRNRPRDVVPGANPSCSDHLERATGCETKAFQSLEIVLRHHHPDTRRGEPFAGEPVGDRQPVRKLDR